MVTIPIVTVMIGLAFMSYQQIHTILESTNTQIIDVSNMISQAFMVSNSKCSRFFNIDKVWEKGRPFARALQRKKIFITIPKAFYCRQFKASH